MENVILLALANSTAASLASLSEQTARYIEAGLQGAANTAKAVCVGLETLLDLVAGPTRSSPCQRPWPPWRAT